MSSITVSSRSGRCLVAVACVSALALAACSSRGGNGGGGGGGGGSTISIGISAAETGYLSASSDIPFIAGAKDAVAAINAAGGVGGKKLDIDKILDEQSVAATGTTNVNQLINQDHVDVLMSGSDSTACASVESAVNRAKVPMTCIAPPPTGSQYQFQVAASVPGMVADMLGYIKSKGIKKVALLSVTTVYGQIIAKIIQGIAAKLGVDVTFMTSVPDSATDLTATMQKVKAAGVGAVVDSITGPEHITEAKGAASAGLTIPLVQITDTTNVFKQAAAAYPNLYFVALPPQAYPHLSNPALLQANKAFVTTYTKAHPGSTSEIAAAAYGWDAVHVIAAAVKKSGAVTGPKLQAAMQSLTYQGVNSLFTYSAADHGGEMTVPNPDSIGHFSSGKLQIVFSAS